MNRSSDFNRKRSNSGGQRLKRPLHGCRSENVSQKCPIFALDVDQLQGAVRPDPEQLSLLLTHRRACCKTSGSWRSGARRAMR